MRAQVFGEPKGVASRALPDGSLDSTMGQLAGVGLGAASAILFAHLLKGASRCVPSPSCRTLARRAPASLSATQLAHMPAEACTTSNCGCAGGCQCWAFLSH